MSAPAFHQAGADFCFIHLSCHRAAASRAASMSPRVLKADTERRTYRPALAE